MKQDSRKLAELIVNSVVVTVSVSKDYYQHVTSEDGDTDAVLLEDESTSSNYEYRAEDYDLCFFGYSEFLLDIVKCFTSEGVQFSVVGSVQTAHWAATHDPYVHPVTGWEEQVSARFSITYNDTTPMADNAVLVTDRLDRDIRKAVG